MDGSILTAFEGFRQHPDSAQLAQGIAFGLNTLGEHDPADRWLQIALSLNKNLPASPVYYFGRDPRLLIAQAELHLERNANAAEFIWLVTGLRLAGHEAEALERLIAPDSAFARRLARGAPGADEIDLLINSVLAARAVGRYDLADRWLQTLEELYETIRAGGIWQQNASLDAEVAALRGDWEAAERHLLLLQPGIARIWKYYLAFDPYLAPMVQRPAVQAFMADQAAKDRAMLERVRREAPPELFDPKPWERSNARPG